MKRIMFVCLAAAMALGSGPVSAQKAKTGGTPTVTTVFTTDIDCEHCAKRIMENIPFEKGVKDVTVDVPDKKVTVVYDASKNSDEGLIKGFAKIRVKAEACTACCEKEQSGDGKRAGGACCDKKSGRSENAGKCCEQQGSRPDAAKNGSDRPQPTGATK